MHVPLLNMPSFRDATINWELLKWLFNIWPMFWVCDKSKAASTSTRISKRAGFTNEKYKKQIWYLSIKKIYIIYFLCCIWVVRPTVDIPSTNLVRKRTLALLNMPSFRDTTINWELLKWLFNIWPMFWVCDKSKAASTSSRIYKGAGFASEK